MKAGMSLRLPGRWKPMVMKGAIDVLDTIGAFRVLVPRWQGVGVVFTLHHVQSSTPEAFSPNRILRITPQYLESVIHQVRRMGYDIISLSEACERLQKGRFDSRFAVFTLDDGYQDNFDVALPVFKANDVPFTVYIATSMPDGTAILWWELLEQLIRQQSSIEIHIGGEMRRFSCATTREKYIVFDSIYSLLRPMSAVELDAFLERLFETYDIDPQAYTRSEAMDWETLSALASEPLCDIGAHTLTHPRMSGLTEADLVTEVVESRERLIQELAVPVEHFAYPFGDSGSAASREFLMLEGLGFQSSVTTRKGVLFPEHANHMSALPRVSLNGDYQTERYTRLFTEGGPFALSNRFKRLNVN